MFGNDWPRTRPVVAGRSMAVATAHPLATMAAVQVLQQGGNAIDAVVAAAVALGVVEPYMSGPGGVGWLLYHRPGEPTRVLNFSGNTPARATPDQFNPETQTTGPRSPLIPGNVAGWVEMLTKFGTRTREQVFAPAIELARQGFPLHPFNVWFIRDNLSRLNPEGLRLFGDVPLRIGAIVRQPDLADSLEQIARDGGESFYRGPMAARIAEHLASVDGLLSREDLANYQPEWVEPIGINYRGRQVMTCPPNNEGFQILQTLKILEGCDVAGWGHNTADYLHHVTEAVKLAVADRIKFAGDPRFHPVPLERLLSDEYCAERRQQMHPTRASRSEGERWRSLQTAGTVRPGLPGGLTTHLSVIDREGQVASITQSLGHGFGSGVYIPGTGIALNNFCHWCEIDPTCPTPNLIAPGKRWACCMAPVQVFQDGKFQVSISTPGSYGILHTTLQMLLNVLEFQADPQQAIEAPRFRVWEETRLSIENRVPAAVREELTRRGHQLELIGDYSFIVGGGQSVALDPQSGARLAGADPRRDGYAWAW